MSNEQMICMTGWKQSATSAPMVIDALVVLREEILKEHQIRDIVVVGMGGSALGARVFADFFIDDLDARGVTLRIVDTTEPSSIQAILDDFNEEQGLVIVSSKSGGTVEPICLGQIFFEHMANVFKSSQIAAQHFISISDADTPLSRLAESENWRGAIKTPQNVGGRFSVLTAFGLAPMILAGMNSSNIISAAQEMQLQCSNESSCPARRLAATLYQGMIEGRDKLIIGHDAESESFARWLEQLIAESLGKDGKGLIPLPMPLKRANSLTGDDLQSISLAQLTAQTVGEDLLRWMFAVEKLASYLELDPFDQPNVEAVKVATRSALTHIANNPNHSQLATTLDDVRFGSADDLPSLVGPNSFIVLISWAPVTIENLSALETLAGDLQDTYGRPVVIAEGPHYLHASGQLYKGGPDSGVYILLTQESEGDINIPEADYTLKQLYEASLVGDLEVMLSLKRPLIRLSFPQP